MPVFILAYVNIVHKWLRHRNSQSSNIFSQVRVPIVCARAMWIWHRYNPGHSPKPNQLCWGRGCGPIHFHYPDPLLFGFVLFCFSGVPRGRCPFGRRSGAKPRAILRWHRKSNLFGRFAWFIEIDVESFVWVWNPNVEFFHFFDSIKNLIGIVLL